MESVGIVYTLFGLLSSLAKILMNEERLEETLKGELTNLKDELMSMDAFLEDVSSMPPDQLESQVKLRAREVRELSHAIETRLHSFMAHIELTQGALLPAMSKLKINQEMESYIKEIIMKIKKVSERHGPYPSKSSLESTSPAWEVGTRMFPMDTRECNHVGLEGAIAKLTKKLSKDDHVSIVGMGGMGKTTLARAVFYKMKGDFDCGAFVPIGQRADMKKILMYIFDGLHMEIYGHERDQHQLTSQLQNFLVDKRCLIVIDDIWDKGTWNFVEHVFKGSSGIKIIITTRNLNIAKGVGGTLHIMKPLSLADSKELLRTKAEVKSHDAEFDTLSDKVLRKCGGVPIAITMIASMLAKIQSKDWHMVYDSIGLDACKDWDFEDIKKVFAYSYYVLPYNIKKCFLYLSLFPEGHWIEKNMLIWRWVAEGLVPDGLFETGETYFNELIDRCMIQWAVSPCGLSPGGCRVHILMLRVIRDLSSSENFSTVLDLDMKQASTSQTGPIHRLAIHKGQNKNSSLQVEVVLSFYACAASSLPPLWRFKQLRVVDLESCDLSVGGFNLEQLSRLKVLKYVGLVGTPIAKLPRRIGHLELLQMLDMTATGIRELPPFVGELRKLRCLRAGNGTRMMGRVGELTCLEELWLHSADKSPDFAAELQKLSKMRVLVIHFDEVDEGMQKKLVESLVHLNKLQVLHFWFSTEGKVRLESWEDNVAFPELRQLLLFRAILPKQKSWIHHLSAPKLYKLLLQVETLEAQHLEILGQMSSLRSLYLRMEDKNRLLYTAGRSEFMVLEYLYTNIELVCGDAALPRIHELELARVWVGTNIGLRGNMPLLERAIYHLDCRGCDLMEVQKAEEELRQASQAHPNSPVLTIKRWNDDVCSSSFQGPSWSDSEYEGQASTDSMPACLNNHFTDSVEPAPPKADTGSVLSFLNSADGAALLLEETAKLTIGPLLSGVYCHINQAGYLDCRHTTAGERLHSAEAMEPTSLKMELLRKITNKFAEERVLGKGAYGKVYRGVCDDGQVVAVKLLYNLKQTIDDEQFIREFKNLMMLKHPNIVRLVGYCYETKRQHADVEGNIVFGETTHKALCFEYMPEGSLTKHLSDECNGLDWQTRYKIIKGACQGLRYLHEGLGKPLYHLDLKPDNILLDGNMAPKLADFGLSKFYGEEQTRMTQSPIGTIGYTPPEYLFGRKVSKKFDIFSLGVVMTKIIAGPSDHDTHDERQKEFLDQVQGNWRKRLQIPSSSPEQLEAQCQQVKRCTEIALSCMDMDWHRRPSIVNILDELNETEKCIEKATNYEQDPSPPIASTSSVV